MQLSARLPDFSSLAQAKTCIAVLRSTVAHLNLQLPGVTAYGNPAQDLQMVEVPEPYAPSADEALVRMEYAPVDYSDLLLANGVYFLNPQLPSVIGGEGAGIVEAIGPGTRT